MRRLLSLLFVVAYLGPVGFAAEHSFFRMSPDRANVPVLADSTAWRLDVPVSHVGPVELYLVDKPTGARNLADGRDLAFSYSGDTVSIARPDAAKDCVIEVVWSNDKWIKAMEQFTASDSLHPAAPGGVLFVGSSTIVGWDLERCFPGIEALNRGFGGSEYVDVVYHADQVILKYDPSTIVIYAGDNDIARGKSPERVYADFETLMRLIRHNLPKAHMVVVSIKPSVARRALWNQMLKVNERMSKYATEEPAIEFVDIAPVLLGADGEPRADLLKEDGLHLNDKGYDAVSALVRPCLGR